MNNPGIIYMCRIKLAEERIKNLENNNFRELLMGAKVVNGTSPKDLNARREEFKYLAAENTKNLAPDVRRSISQKSGRNIISSKLFGRNHKSKDHNTERYM